MSVQELVGHIATKRAEWDGLLEQVPNGRLHQPLLSDWSVRDAVAILMWREQRVTEMIRSRTVTDVSFKALPEAEQARILEAGRALPLETLLDQHRSAHREMLAALTTLTDADLNASEGIVGLPPDEPFWKAIAGPTWWSYPTFSAPLRQLLNENASDLAD